MNSSFFRQPWVHSSVERRSDSRAGSPRRLAVRKASKRRRPSIEGLEDRTLLATMLWNLTTGGDWDVDNNWVNQNNSSDHHIPTSSDTATINLTSAGTVTHITVDRGLRHQPDHELRDDPDCDQRLAHPR